MSAMTPMSDGAKFVILDDGETLSATFDDGNGHVTDIAWQAPDASQDVFRWLISSAATFHKIPLENGADHA